MADLDRPHGQGKAHIALPHDQDALGFDRLHHLILARPDRSAGCSGHCSGVGRLRLIEVLILCTANICRSPAAEALLRERLTAIGVDAAVRSAGLLEGGSPASSGSVDLLARRGLDLSSHRSRTMTRREITSADLVLGMAREHVREAVVMAPEAWSRAFTLKELVRRGSLIGPRADHEPLGDWLARAGRGRTTIDLMGRSDEDDVSDPYGLSLPVYSRMIEELDHQIDRLVGLLWAGSLESGSLEYSGRPPS